MTAYLIIFGIIILILSIALFIAVENISNMKVRLSKQEKKLDDTETNQRKIVELLKLLHDKIKARDISNLN